MGNLSGEDGRFVLPVRLKEISTTQVAIAGWGQLYTKASDNDLYFMDSAGNEINLFTGGSIAFTSLSDTPSGYTTATALYRVNAAGNAVEETTVLVTEGANTFAFAKGTASLDIAAGATLNIDKGLKVDGNAGTLTFSAASKVITVEDTTVVNQDLTTDASPTFAGGVFTGVVTGITPVASTDFAIKGYVDAAVGFHFDYFVNNTASDIGGIYYDMDDVDLGGGESTLTVAGLSVGDNQALVNFATLSGKPAVESLASGVYRFHYHVERTAGNRDVNIYIELYKRAAGGTEVLLGTSNISGLVTSKAEFEIHITVSTEITILATDRLVIKLYANVGASGSDVDIAIYQEGTTSSRFTFDVTSAILSELFVRRDGTKGLSANWDAGAFEIRAQTFQSDVTTGTAPLIVASTTKVTNLNADLLDGEEASAFQDVDASLTSIAGLTYASDSFIKVTAEDTYAIRTLAQVKADLDLEIGTDVQAYDAGLASLAGLTYASASFIKVTAEDTYAIRTIAETQSDLGINAWQTWTPTLTQSGSINITIDEARYVQIGKTVIVHCKITATAAGTGNNIIYVGGFPTPATSAILKNVGSFSYRDGAVYYAGIVVQVSATQLEFYINNVGNRFGIDPNFAVANTDILSLTISYEVS